MPREPKKPLPNTDLANLDGADILRIVSIASNSTVSISDADASEWAVALNYWAYMGLSANTHRGYYDKIKDAAETLLSHLDAIGYPMLDQLARLHTSLEAAKRYLVPPGLHEPEYEPYQPAAIHVHSSFSCSVCVAAGFKAATTRDSIAVRITAAVLKRFGYAITEGALELYFQKIDLANKLKGEYLRPTKLRGARE